MQAFQYFFDTKETVPADVGWSHYGLWHLFWLAVMAAFITLISVRYRKRDAAARARWRKTMGLVILGMEICKLTMLALVGRYTHEYLPLHLCSVNILLINVHARRSGPVLDNFLYGICIPGAMAAMIFPDWTMLPYLNYNNIHSFIIHILLVAYPVMVTAGGDLKPDWRKLPRCLLFTLAMAVPVYLFNLKFGTNFMFLMRAEEGNPLLLFEQMWGHHLLGVPVLGTVLIGMMYLILWLCRRNAVRK